MLMHYIYIYTFSLEQKPFQLCFNVLPYTSKIYKLGYGIMQHVTITSTRYHMRYHTFALSLTWLGCNTKCCNNLNVLLHVLPHILFKFSIIWDYLRHFNTCYRQIYKKKILFKKFYDCGVWQSVPNSIKKGKV